MAKQHAVFGPEGITEEQLTEWHNVPIRIRYRDQVHGGPGHTETVLGWEAMETTTGSLVIQRLILLDPEHPTLFGLRTVAAGAWLDVEKQGAVWDLEAIKQQEQKAAEAAAAEKLGVPGRNGPTPLRRG